MTALVTAAWRVVVVTLTIAATMSCTTIYTHFRDKEAEAQWVGNLAEQTCTGLLLKPVLRAMAQISSRCWRAWLA